MSSSPPSPQDKKRGQFPRSALTPAQSPKYWVKEKDRYLRQILIGDIEELTKRPLVIYFAQLDQQINHTDPDDLSEVLSGITGSVADVMIQTPGGVVDATEKLVGILQKKLTDCRIIVPSWAKSAGTVIALSSKTILMGINSELGPIDPQWPVAGIGYVPCEILGQDPTQSYSVREMAKLAVARNRALALSLLRKGMMKGKPDTEIESVLDKISTSTGYKSHGAVIDFDEAKNLGLAVEYLQPDNDLWKKLWLLYCMYDYDTKTRNVGRIMEGSAYSIARQR